MIPAWRLLRLDEKSGDVTCCSCCTGALLAFRAAAALRWIVPRASCHVLPAGAACVPAPADWYAALLLAPCCCAAAALLPAPCCCAAAAPPEKDAVWVSSYSSFLPVPAPVDRKFKPRYCVKESSFLLISICCLPLGRPTRPACSCHACGAVQHACYCLTWARPLIVYSCKHSV